MDGFKDYRHNPPHIFIPNAMYMITGSTIRKQPFFEAENRRTYFIDTLHEQASRLGWKVEAWTILTNHYHFIARSPEDTTTLSSLIRSIHSLSARYVNKLDNQPSRRIWHNYWDKCINSDMDYLARLHYVMLNPVKHGIVDNAMDYEFSSYRLLMELAKPEFQRQVLSQSVDDLNIEDNF